MKAVWIDGIPAFLAGVVALSVLEPLHNIGWAIEYGDMGYPGDKK